MALVQTSICDASIVSNEPVAHALFKIVLRAPELAGVLRAGQFMELAVPGDASQILRIPLSFSGIDKKAGTVEIVYALVGDATLRLSQMVRGACISVVGPCGHPWRTQSAQTRSVVVSGGVGITPIVACAELLHAQGIAFDAVIGARNAASLWGSERLHELGAGEVILTTDDGSAGIHGFTTEGLSQLLARSSYDTIYTCGPEPMMGAIAHMAHEAQVSCQVSMERMMSCGFGACATCNVEMVDGTYASACKDGTVFDAEKVAW